MFFVSKRLLSSKPATYASKTAAGRAFQEIVKNHLQSIEEAGTYKRERFITSAQKSKISVNAASEAVLNFCANNYLGLSNHPAIKEGGKSYIDSHGAGLSSVRFICGTQDIHKKLERDLADFHGMDDAILYGSCFDANGGMFEVLLNDQDAVISDSLNHASIIDGVRLSKAKRFRYDSCDMKSLETQLIEADKQGARTKLIATDGAFSMDGRLAPLKEICDLADKYKALVFIDECHATGFIGKHGRGTAELKGVEGRIDIINSTMGKALGGAMGGYTVASQAIVDLLRQRSRPYLFSNSLAPAVVGIAQSALELIRESDHQREILLGNTTRFRTKMTKAGFRIKGDAEHPIAPVMIGDARLASQMADKLLLRGIYVIGFSFPVVPKGEARIRVQLSAAHTTEQVDFCINAFTEVGKELGII